MTEITVRRRAEDPTLLAAVEELRLAAWEPITGRSHAAERFGLDEHDERSWHCLVLDDGTGQLLAAGRLTACGDLADLPEATSFEPHADEMELPLGVAGRLVVHPDQWGRGLAERIIVDRLELARELELVEVWGETRRDQVHGLLRHGYRCVGPSQDRSVVGDWEILKATL